MYAKDLLELVKISAALAARAPSCWNRVQLEFASGSVAALVTDGHHGSIFTLRDAALRDADGGPAEGTAILDPADCAVLVAACAAHKGATLTVTVADGRVSVYLGGRELASVGGPDRGPMPPVREALAAPHTAPHTAIDHGFALGLLARVCGAGEKWLGPKAGTLWTDRGDGARLDARSKGREFESVIMGMRL